MFNSGFKKLTAGIALVIGLGSGSANAAINNDGLTGNSLSVGAGSGVGELFFSIYDNDIDGDDVDNSRSLTLDLNVTVQSFLANPLGFSLQSNELQTFIAEGINRVNAFNADPMNAGNETTVAMEWNISGVNNFFNGADFSTLFLLTTVDSDATAEPIAGPANGTFVFGLQQTGKYLAAVNSLAVNDVAIASGSSGDAFYPNGVWGNNVGGALAFDNSAEVINNETAAMVIIGATSNGSATELVENATLAAGFWSLDQTTGTVSFAPVPIPGAVWLFGSAIVGMLGFRSRA